jgi:hypothetical protein
MPAPELPPPAPVTPLPAGPRCAACSGAAVVHWLRRPTDDEVADAVRVEQDRRAERLLLADPQLPKPEFGPLPTGDGMTRAVYACGPHAITMDAAAHIHASSCTAPNNADLPGCDCTPEPLPYSPVEEEAAAPLPDHWVTGGA